MALELSDDGKRALREAENLCWRTRVGIVAAEHLLCGALIAAAETGTTGLPDPAALEVAVVLVHGSGDSDLTQNVMFGSGAREALNVAARDATAAGAPLLSAAAIAGSVIRSGEVNPMLYGSIGVSRESLLEALGAPEAEG